MFAALVGDKGYPISSEFWRQLLELPLTQKRPPNRVLQACHAFDQSVEYFLMKGVLDYIGSVDVSPESCYLHHELLNLMLVLVSTQLCSGPSPEPKDVHPFIDAAMLQESSIVALVVQKLLLNFVRRPQIPSNGSDPVFSDDGVPGVLQRVGSAAANFVLLPYCILNYVASASAEGVTSQLADNSLLVLLILIHYQKSISMNKSILTDGVYMSDSNTKAKDTPAFHENPYCKSLNNVAEMNCAAVDRADVEGNAQNGPVVRLSFASLLDALVTCLKDESSALLFYSLVHGNCDFQEYVLVRTDLDTLLMPILEMLYNTSRKTSNQIYMMLIILLILSQDSTFNASVHKLVLPSVPWYQERLMHQTYLGSLMVVVLIRTIKYNLPKLRDVYLHTNCLAILANMGPHEHRLSPYASQRLVSLFDMLSRKYVKLDELKNDKALKVMSDQMETDIISDDTFNSQNSFISSQVGLGLAVQGPDSWHSKCEEQQGFAEGVSTEAATTTRANANTNEDDTETPSSNLSSSKGEGAKLSSGTRVSPKQHKKAMIHKDFRFIGCLLLIIASMILPSSEARRIGRFSDPEFCSDHHLLSSRIAVACIPIQPEPMCCELLVPAMDSKGCVCKLMNDGTELDNFLMKYTSCGGQHPEFLEKAQNCSLVLPNEAAPMPAVPEIAPTQEVPEVVVLARKSKNVISLQWLWLLLLFVVLGGLLFCIVCELKKKREAGRVRPQSQDVQLTERVTVHPRQTADDMIRNQHVEIPVIEELPFLGPTEAGRVRPQSQDVQLTDRVTVHPRQTADDMIRNQHVEIPVIEELPFLGPNEAGRVRPQSQDVQLTDSVTMRPRQTADGMIRNQHVEIPVIEELPFLGPMTRSRFVAMKDKAVGTKESTSD